MTIIYAAVSFPETRLYPRRRTSVHIRSPACGRTDAFPEELHKVGNPTIRGRGYLLEQFRSDGVRYSIFISVEQKMRGAKNSVALPLVQTQCSALFSYCIYCTFFPRRRFFSLSNLRPTSRSYPYRSVRKQFNIIHQPPVGSSSRSPAVYKTCFSFIRAGCFTCLADERHGALRPCSARA